jgi:hypothetical protein
MALGLAIIIVVIIGVMGAGLLTLVATDLKAVIEVNRGEQAFELAEAGVEIAKAHLADDPSAADWSSGKLRVDGVGDNSVSIVVLRDGRDGFFKVVSTGRYDHTRRKTEALFTVGPTESGRGLCVSRL